MCSRMRGPLHASPFGQRSQRFERARVVILKQCADDGPQSAAVLGFELGDGVGGRTLCGAPAEVAADHRGPCNTPGSGERAASRLSHSRTVSIEGARLRAQRAERAQARDVAISGLGCDLKRLEEAADVVGGTHKATSEGKSSATDRRSSVASFR